MVTLRSADSGAAGEFPQFGGGAAVQALETGVESAHASESGGEGGLRERKIRLVDEGLGEVQSTRLYDGYGSGSEMLQEQAAKLARSDAEAGGEVFEARVGEAVLFDQAQ